MKRFVLAPRRVRLFKPMTLQRPVLKKFVNQMGIAALILSLKSAPLPLLDLDFDEGGEVVGGLMMDCARCVWMAGGERKAEVVTYSMYAWVREAVVLRRGARRRAMRRGGARGARGARGWVSGEDGMLED